MKKTYYEKFNTIIPNKFKYLYLVFVLVLFVALAFQLTGISSLIPLSSSFFGKTNDIEINVIEILKNYIPFFVDFSDFFIFLTLTTVLIVVSNIIFLISAYLSSTISYAIERDIKIKLYNHYLYGDYKNFFKTETSDLLSLLLNETQRVSSQVLIPLADIVSRIFIVFGIFGYLIYLMPKQSFFILLILFIFYFLFFMLIKKRIQINNILLSTENKQIVKIANNIFSFYKEIKIYSLENSVLKDIIDAARKIKKIKFFSTFFSNSPRYFIEIILFIGIYIFLFFQKSNMNYFAETYLLVIIYSLFKILPSIQGIFSLFVVISSHINSVNEIYNQIKKIKPKEIKQNIKDKKNKILEFKSIKLRNISFKYNQNKILDKTKLDIYKGDKIGIEGPSGSGKSTFINIVSGLLKEDQGKIYLNDKLINSQELLNFSKINLGYVSQNPSIFEGSIMENIILEKQFEKKLFSKCIKMSELDLFIKKSKMGYKKKIHGSSFNLSGGQIQRILIARALYRNPKLILIDEGFSQLDRQNETKLLNKLLKIKNITIVIVYHKLSNKNLLNKIYKLKNRKLYLVNNN